jgi:AAA domain
MVCADGDQDQTQTRHDNRGIDNINNQCKQIDKGNDVQNRNRSTVTKINAKAANGPEVSSDLLMPTLGELLKLTIPERQCLLRPWLREHESCLLYAATGVGKSLFALTARVGSGWQWELLRMET